MRVTEAERSFLHELHHIKKDPLGKRIIHFCVSAAPNSNERGQKLEIASQFISRSFAKSPYCKIFPAHNGDLFVTYSHVTVSEVLRVCARVEKVFMDGEQSTNRNPYGEYGFYKIADASKDLEAVFVAFKAILQLAQPDGDGVAKQPMNAENLQFVGEKLRTMDLRHCIFNQPVYYVGEKVPSIEFLEFFVSTREIENHLVPQTSLTGHAWLFHALKEDLDRAVMRVMAQEVADYRHKAFSLNVALATVLDRDFEQFHQSLPTRLAGKLILEVHKTDVVQHMDQYREVRAMAEQRGLKLCVDGLEWQDFEALTLSRLQPHFCKIGWREDMLAASEGALSALVAGIRGLGAACLPVLSRCDNAKAFTFARELGIRYVQGRLADQYFKTGMALA